MNMDFLDSYVNMPPKLSNALDNEDVYILLELYHPNTDDIFNNPASAIFSYAEHDIIWQGQKYSGKIKEFPNWRRFIGKQFNQLSVQMLNVARGKDSASFLVLNSVIRGYRVALRICFKGAEINDTRLVWWGRLDSVGSLTTESVQLNASQEIGNFDYEIGTDTFSQSCPLLFAGNECKGKETFAQKTQLYQDAFNKYGQGGCNRTFERCRQFSGYNSDGQIVQQERFYQGQRLVAVSGKFIRIETQKKKFLWIFSYTKKTAVPVQWNSFNQESNQNVTIPIPFGRAKLEGQAITWADTGSQIQALVGFGKAGIYGAEGIYDLKSEDTDFPIVSFTVHNGFLGGEGNQQPDSRFPESGFNSRLLYAGITYGGSSLEDAPDSMPYTTAIVKGLVVPVRDRFTGEMHPQWTHNPVWLCRYFLTHFRYQVIRSAWFNEEANQFSADWCYTPVEDDTNADIASISGSEYPVYLAGDETRYHSASRYDSRYLRQYELEQDLSLMDELSNSDTGNFLPETDIILGGGDIDWFPNSGNPETGIKRTFLQFRYTLNGVIRETVTLSDLFYGLLFPAFRGFLHFDHFGKVSIQCKRPAPNAYVRQDALAGQRKIPITNVSKLLNKKGYLLIGVGQTESEIGVERGAEYVNACQNTEVSVTTQGYLNITSGTGFIGSANETAKVVMDFSGVVTAGEKITIKFIDDVFPTSEQQTLEWDYVVDSVLDSVANVVTMVKTRLEASMSFNEFWTAEIPVNNPTRLIIRCQTGYLLLDKPLAFNHEAGQEILRVVEVYENNKDETNPLGLKDNIISFTANDGTEEIYNSVKSVYISAINNFIETEISPRTAWDTIEQERNVKTLSLDLRYVDNYRQAAWVTKSNFVDFVNGALYGRLTTFLRGMMHQENDVVAVKYQTLEGVGYLPFSVNDISVNKGNLTTLLGLKLYLSAAFDERVAQEEKFSETTLTRTPDTTTPPSTIAQGGYSTTRTGDGNADRPQNVAFEPQPYKLLPERFWSQGRDTL